ncbi:hypothetical protein [Candidatus Poriferisodalis sp.]|uniref:hypothetical protein n=1 Tax=Candidatus Poriferisodalis sp. TaxID=3101277 RepID=UPI003D0AF669
MEELESIRLLIIELEPVASAALQRLHEGRDRVLSSTVPADVLAGVQQYQLAKLDIAESESDSIALASQGWALTAAYEDVRWGALAAGEITENELWELDEAGRSVRDIAREISDQLEPVRALWHESSRAYMNHSVLETLVLRDASGLAAFWLSLNESCKA